MGNRILLINPNRYRTPPVIPVGLEYVASSLDDAGHDVHILDLCFDDDPVSSVRKTIDDFNPTLAGTTIRNIDNALFNNNTYFLPEITKIAGAVKDSGVPLVLGGSGFAAAPEIILEETGADYGVTGPGEVAFKQLAGAINTGNLPQNKIIRGWEAGIEPHFTPKRPFGTDYRRYIAEGGIVGFATQYGCPESCCYCIEAETPVIFREPGAVIRELASLAGRGYTDFHLCDSEFNLDLDFSERFASSLADAALPISWALYIKPAPWSEIMFAELKRSNATTITLSVDSFELSAENPRYTFSGLASIINICRDLEIKLAVDLLTGCLDEPLESTETAIDFFKAHRPDTVGVNIFFRIYPETRLKKILQAGRERELVPKERVGSSAIEPVFYNHLSLDRMRELICGDPIFKIEGFERTTNYERLRRQES